MKSVRLNGKLVISALPSVDLLSDNLIATSDAEYRLLSVKLVAGWSNVAVIDGGLMFGVAHSDYTDTEIEECIESTTSISPGDKIANEKANRLVRIIGMMTPAGTTGNGEAIHNDGRPTTTKLNWAIPIGKQVKMWVYNTSNAGWSSGSELSLVGTCVVKYQ